jgi:hypothetical protein
MAGKPAAALLGISLLGSCTAETQRVGIRMDEDLQTSFAGAVYEQVDEEDEPDGNVMAGMEAHVENCGLQANSFRVENGYRMNVSLKDVDLESLEGYLACVPLLSKRQFNLRPSYEDGWFFRYYKLAGSITTPRCYPRKESDGPGKTPKPLSSAEAQELHHAFPQRVEVAMPSPIVSVTVKSDVKGGRYVARRDGAVATIVWEPGQLKLAKAVRDRHCAALPIRQRTAESDVLDVTITSRVANFDLNTLLTIFGILVGSGIFVEVLRRLLRKKRPS